MHSFAWWHYRCLYWLSSNRYLSALCDIHFHWPLLLLLLFWLYGIYAYSFQFFLFVWARFIRFTKTRTIVAFGIHQDIKIFVFMLVNIFSDSKYFEIVVFQAQIYVLLSIWKELVRGISNYCYFQVKWHSIMRTSQKITIHTVNEVFHWSFIVAMLDFRLKILWLII